MDVHLAQLPPKIFSIDAVMIRVRSRGAVSQGKAWTIWRAVKFCSGVFGHVEMDALAAVVARITKTNSTRKLTVNSQLEQFTMDSGRSPQRIRHAHFSNQVAGFPRIIPRPIPALLHGKWFARACVHRTSKPDFCATVSFVRRKSLHGKPECAGMDMSLLVGEESPRTKIRLAELDVQLMAAGKADQESWPHRK
jgi:hypothetical protein